MKNYNNVVIFPDKRNIVMEGVHTEKVYLLVIELAESIGYAADSNLKNFYGNFGIEVYSLLILRNYRDSATKDIYDCSVQMYGKNYQYSEKDRDTIVLTKDKLIEVLTLKILNEQKNNI